MCPFRIFAQLATRNRVEIIVGILSVVCALAADCNRPQWIIRENETVIGSPSPLTMTLVQDCLDYCIKTSSCVGVDIDYLMTPVQCWPHSDEGDYVESNIFKQDGTTSYQLITRCATTVSPETSEVTTTTMTC